MSFRALISDLDGTLLDTLQDLADSVNAALIRLGLPMHELDAYRGFVGEGRRIMALRALPEHRRDEATIAEMLAGFTEEYDKRWICHSRPYDGIAEMLDSATAREVRLAVLSNKPQGYTESMVSKLLPEWSFDFILGESPRFPRKPDPSGAKHIVQGMNLEPKECIYIGDSGIDMQTAAAAGLYGVGVLWGFRTAEELLANGARVVVRHPSEIVRLLSH